ncbi:MAG: NUDIX hydrolase, partial [Planctomycetes bacterium]|nr:NUDIX hydrolase [Planctomycetota bacterium]
RGERIRSDPRFELISSVAIGRGDIVTLLRERIRLPNGHETEQDLLQLPDAVAVVPILVEGGEPVVVLVEQFRNSVKGHMHEIPAGMVEPGEDPARTARRELEEETGYRARRWRHLASLLAVPGISGHRLHFFLAEELEAGRQRLERTECLRVRRFPLAALARSLLEDPPDSTVVVDAKTHLALLHAHLHLEALRAKAEGEDRG